jgi:hypothetical protein
MPAAIRDDVRSCFPVARDRLPHADVSTACSGFANVLHADAHDVTPCGKNSNRNAARESGTWAGKRRNNPGGRRDCHRLAQDFWLGAGPRSKGLARHMSAARRRPGNAAAVVGGNVGSARAAVLGPGHCPGSADWPASAASVRPPLGSQRCNNALAAVTGETTVRTLSTGSAGTESAGHERREAHRVLDPGRPESNIEMDPRESSLPDGQASEGSR